MFFFLFKFVRRNKKKLKVWPDIQPIPSILILFLHRLYIGGLDVYLVLVEGEKEVCDNIGLQLGIGAGLLVFLIGLVTIVIYKCCIVVSISSKYCR